MKTITYDDTLYQLVPKELIEEMNIAAIKVLHRAHGIDGLPQRMLDAMLSAAPTPPAQPAERKPLTDEQCDSIYLALHGWAQDVDSYDFGLPMYSGGGMEAGREIIRNAANGITEPKP